MAAKHLLRISERAAKSYVTPHTLRFYLQEELLPQPINSRNPLAAYSADYIEKIKVIKRACKQKSRKS